MYRERTRKQFTAAPMDEQEYEATVTFTATVRVKARDRKQALHRIAREANGRCVEDMFVKEVSM